jgi:hypothetical protein
LLYDSGEYGIAEGIAGPMVALKLQPGNRRKKRGEKQKVRWM